MRVHAFFFFVTQNKMIKTTYRWKWTNDDGSERKVEISTFQSKDVAKERALSYFPTDPVAIEHITNTEPEVESEAA